MDRAAPNIDQECGDPVGERWRADVRRLLRDRHHVDVDIDARSGNSAAVVVAVLGTERRAHEMFVFTRAKDGDHALDRAVDYTDGVVAEVAKAGGPEAGRFLPLDWEGRPYDGDVVFVRGEVRDYDAEEGAAKLLGEEPPPRALGRPAGLVT